MIEGISERAAIAIKNINKDETASVAIMKFSLIIIFNSLLTILLSSIIGAAFGKFQEIVIIIIAFATLRFFSGGFHFKTAMTCTLISTGLIVIIPFITITDQISKILTIASLILVAIFAPSNIQGVARMSEKYFPLLKVVSILLVCSNLFFTNHILALSFFIQSISLIRLKEV